jgi:UDP-N-acetylmuramate dehydrogenase
MQIYAGYSLKRLNTFGLNVVADYYVKFVEEAQIIEFLEARLKHFSKHMILGGGSNVLFTNNFPGLVIHMANKGISLVDESDHSVVVKAAAGEIWDDLVAFCTTRNWGGLENLSLIPGTVGAAPIQNIGAYGVEQKDCFYELTAYDKFNNKIVTITNAECKFLYRESIFKNREKGRYIILSVSYKLSKKPSLHLEYGGILQELRLIGMEGDFSIGDVRNAVINIRKRKLPDPEVIGNAGSFFKNPSVEASAFVKLKSSFPEVVAFEQPDGTYKLAAGWLIENCGWKGKTIGQVGVHQNQALVLVNYGNATGADLLELANRIQQSVYQRFGVHLEMEVNII